MEKVMLLLLATLVLTGCEPSTNTGNTIAINSTTLGESDYGARVIVVSSTNTSNRMLSYVSYSYSLYDDSGVHIGVAVGNTSNVPPGARFNVEVVPFGADWARAELSDVTYF